MTKLVLYLLNNITPINSPNIDHLLNVLFKNNNIVSAKKCKYVFSSEFEELLFLYMFLDVLESIFISMNY